MKEKITLEPLTDMDIYRIWQIGYSHTLPEWKKWDAPYFEDYQMYPDFEIFRTSKDYTFLLKDTVRGIFVNQKPIGIVTKHWENEKTRWLEIGIVIYNQDYWNGGYGTQALLLWIDEIFETISELEHIGLTTWSGNFRMMRTAEKIGMLKEAQIRKVRYWQEYYYDSVKYGILRNEWLENRKTSSF